MKIFVIICQKISVISRQLRLIRTLRCETQGMAAKAIHLKAVLAYVYF